MRTSNLLILATLWAFLLMPMVAAPPASAGGEGHSGPAATPSPRKITRVKPSPVLRPGTSRSSTPAANSTGTAPEYPVQYNPKENGTDKAALPGRAPAANAGRTETVDNNETVTRSRKRRP